MALVKIQILVYHTYFYFYVFKFTVQSLTMTKILYLFSSVMNPWDPNQAPMMTFALQTYQHQWLLQQQQQQQQLGSQDEEAAITHEMEEEAFQKNKVICIPPDDEMGFLLNLPPPCNVVLQPSQIGLSGKVPESPFMQAYQKFLRGM